MPERIRLSRARGWRLPDNAVNCARPGRWGNPLIVGRHGTRRECVALYRQLILFGVLAGDMVPAQIQKRTRDWVWAHREDLRGKDLACWCPLDGMPCHADVLLGLANR
jgi:hypothetical protein